MTNLIRDPLPDDEVCMGVLNCMDIYPHQRVRSSQTVSPIAALCPCLPFTSFVHLIVSSILFIPSQTKGRIKFPTHLTSLPLTSGNNVSASVAGEEGGGDKKEKERNVRFILTFTCT